MVQDERVKEIIDYLLEHGERKTCEDYGLTEESIGRYRRIYKSKYEGEFESRALLKQLGEKFSPQELQALVKGAQLSREEVKAPPIHFDGDVVKFGFITDPHMGSIYFVESYFDQALEVLRKEGAQFLAIGGDITEGMFSGRPGHIYELAKIGYKAQRNYAIEQLSKWRGPLYAIDGNHDRTFIKVAGALIVEDICKELPNATFLGNDEGDIPVEGITVKLWHGEDGSSYATSYRVQKIIESFTGGEKPNVLLVGHTHKQVYIFERHIHAVSGGALCKQSKWMRGKRLANHIGFHLITMHVNEHGVVRFLPEFFPFFA